MYVCMQGHLFKGKRHHPTSSACAIFQAAARSIAFLARFLAPWPGRGVFCSPISATRGGVLVRVRCTVSHVREESEMAYLYSVMLTPSIAVHKAKAFPGKLYNVLYRMYLYNYTRFV